MSVSYLITFTVRADQDARFLSLLNGVLDAMREEPMFRSATLHRDPDQPRRYLLHETWADHRDVLEVQLARPYRAAWHAALPELLEGEREISLWQTLRSDASRASLTP
ncbi:MAG: antibiotic biosynthesis monooxygenase [Rhizobiales bacterium 32-66-8]|nr:MAG: antibiotic biosynthesis monooxygenase [Rhizobiales bacterium 32-66-8]